LTRHPRHVPLRAAALTFVIAAMTVSCVADDGDAGRVSRTNGQYGEAPHQQYTLVTSNEVERTDGERAPLAVFIHGGGWTVGSRHDMKDVAALDRLIADGWAVASIDYTLAGPHPAQIDDVRRAVRHLRENRAELGLDTRSLILLGFSAGGHLALLAGATIPGIDGVVALAPVTDLAAISVRLPDEVAILLGCEPIEPLCNPEALAELDPIAALDPSDPPVYVMVGRIDDLTVPSEQVTPYITAARSILGSRQTWRDVFDGAGHMDVQGKEGRVVEFASWVRSQRLDDSAQSG
jgi:acetyl esterase/lipase